MIYLRSFEAIHYRGLDGLSLPQLSHVNLITGMNGVGKTALLEAIWLFMGRHNPSLLWNLNVLRTNNPVFDPIAALSDGALELHGTEVESSQQWRVTFKDVANTPPPVTEVSAIDNPTQLPVVGRLEIYLDGKLVRNKNVGAYPTPRGLVMYDHPNRTPRECVIESIRWQHETPGEYMQRYSTLVKNSRKHELKSAMNLVLPKLKDMEILTDESGKPYMSAITTDGDQLPLKDLGGGIVRLFRLYLDFFAARNGILLVDEVENGIHYSVLRDLWERIRLWTHESKVQFIATTHSAECIDAAMAAFADYPKVLSIHKLFTNAESKKVEAATFTGETLKGARDLHLEVR